MPASSHRDTPAFTFIPLIDQVKQALPWRNVSEMSEWMMVNLVRQVCISASLVLY